MGEESSTVSKPTPDDDELPSFITSSGFQIWGEHADTNEDAVEPDDIESGSQEHGEHDFVHGDLKSGSQEPGELVHGDGVSPRRSTRHSRPQGQLLEHMGQPQASGIVLHEDNHICIALCKNTVTTGHNNHIDVKMYFCREKRESDEIVVKYCPTEVMLADALTKPLTADMHGQLTKAIMESGSE
jgi:hypothetical protein